MTSQPYNKYGSKISGRLGALGLHRGYLYTFIILTALLAFETFNYSTTQFALSDLLGSLTFAGVSWATILSIAFCGIDFAGIARLFTTEEGAKGPTEVWYLFGAWLLAATMNAILTWWAVSLALEDHILKSSSVLSPSLLIKAVPIFVAVMVWLIRILIIGSLSMAGDRLFDKAERQNARNQNEARNYNNQQNSNRSYYTPPATAAPGSKPATSFQPIHRASIRQEATVSRPPVVERNVEPVYMPPEPEYSSVEPVSPRPEPVYQPISASPKQSGGVRKM